MALSGIFQGLSQGSEQSLGRQLYMKQAQEEQNRQGMMHAEEISFRNKQFDASQSYQNTMLANQQNAASRAQERWRVSESNQQEYRTAQIARAAEEGRLTAAHRSDMLGFQENRLTQDATQHSEMAGLQQNRITQDATQHSAEMAHKQAVLTQSKREATGRFIGGVYDRVADAVGGIRDAHRWQSEHQLNKRRVSATEESNRIDALSAAGDFLSGGGRGRGTSTGSGVGGSTPGVRSQSIELSQDQINTYANDMMVPLSQLNQWWLFPDKKMTENELNTYAKERGQLAASYVGNAGHKPGSPTYKFYASSIYNAMLGHPEFKRVRGHAQGSGDESRVASNFRKSFYEGAGMGLGISPVSTDKDNIKSQIDNALGGKKMNREQKKSQRLESAGEILGQDLDELYQKRGIRGMMAGGMRVGGMALQSGLDDYVGRPLGWMHDVWSGPQRVQQSNAPQTIKSSPDIADTVPNQVQQEQQAMNAYAEAVSQMSYEQLLGELNAMPQHDPRRDIIDDALGKRIGLGILQGIGQYGTQRQQ